MNSGRYCVSASETSLAIVVHGPSAVRAARCRRTLPRPILATRLRLEISIGSSFGEARAVRKAGGVGLRISYALSRVSLQHLRVRRSVAGSEAGPMVGLVDIAAGADFHVPVEAAFAAVHAQAPEQCAGDAVVDHRVEIALAMCGISTKPNSPTKVRLLALRGGVGSRIAADEVGSSPSG